MNYLLFMMGGSGTRVGSDIPKQYIDINGIPLFYYTLEEYSKINCVDKVIIVSNPVYIDLTYRYAKKILSEKLCEVVQGSDTRLKSVRNGIFCANKYCDNDSVILIHDASNPFVPNNEMSNFINLVKENRAAVIGTNQVHTIYQFDSNNNILKDLPRDVIGSGYSPEGFMFEDLYNLFVNINDDEILKMTSTVAIANKLGIRVKFYPVNILNLKITYQYDLEIYKRLICDLSNKARNI